MGPKKFTGKCEAKFLFNGIEQGEFNTTDVLFTQSLFEARLDNKSVQINYGDDLEPGTHSLTFSGSNSEWPLFIYYDGVRGRPLSGTASVTIVDSRDKQTGSFDVTLFDSIGRLLSFKGDFEASFEL